MYRDKIRDIPKYTQYELSDLVKEKVDNSNKSIDELSLYFGLSNKILSEIIEGKRSFKTSHYNAVSIILNKSMEELFSNLEYDENCYFILNNNSIEIEEFIYKMEFLFSEFIYQSKLRGYKNSP